MRTLLTKQEAVIRSELGAKFPQCELSEIFQTEEWEFNNCLGWELLEKMRLAENDYCNVPAWTSKEYNIGSLVKNGGLVWISKRGGTNTEPLAENEYWALAPKFNSESACGCDETETIKCGKLYNDLWCMYLARYLSLKVAKLTIPRIAVDVSGSGVSRKSPNGAVPADKSEISFLMTGIEVQIVQVFDNMMNWISRQDREDCFGAFDEACKPVIRECGTKEKNAGKSCEASKSKTVGYSVY